MSAIREARARGVPIYGESLHQYMLYTSEDYKTPNGQIYHTYPSLKSAEDQAALWAGTLDGCDQLRRHRRDLLHAGEEAAGVRIDDTTGGNAGVEPRVALMYTEMVGKRGYSLSRFVDLVSTNAAKIMGLYPRKGALAAGSDADICVLDPADKRVIRAADLHEADYTPWEGRKMEAWPCLTVLRGKVVVENGECKGSLTDGKWQHRKIARKYWRGRICNDAGRRARHPLCDGETRATACAADRLPGVVGRATDSVAADDDGVTSPRLAALTACSTPDRTCVPPAGCCKPGTPCRQSPATRRAIDRRPARRIAQRTRR